MLARNPKLTLMLLVKNEADRYLNEMLESASSYVDEIVVLDDNSSDNTFDICESQEKVVLIERADVNMMFANSEYPLRERLFEMTLRTNPEWIIALDADEIVEDRFANEIKEFLRNAGNNHWFGLAFYNFWRSTTHYRTDSMLKPCNIPRIFKHTESFKYEWRETRLHCGSIPNNIITSYPGEYTGYRVKHYGHVERELAKRKYSFYIERDPDGQIAPRKVYEAMLDDKETAVLKEWVEKDIE